MIIRGTPDIFRFGSHTNRALGSTWLKSSIAEWQGAIAVPQRDITLDLSNIEFIASFEWLTVVAMMERLLSNPNTLHLAIDLVGTTGGNVIPLSEYISVGERDKRYSEFTQKDYELSDKVYRVVGFLEALGTRDVLNVGPEREGKVFYPHISAKDISLRSAYTTKENNQETVVLGISRVARKADCRQFLDKDNILNWRDAMGRRFQQSPLFESEEVWRVLCHELAVNILEHSGSVGFIAARVVQSPFQDKRPKPWTVATYAHTLGRLHEEMKEGFLELCVADAGRGFIETLTEAYIEHTNIPRHDVRALDVLIFAFDELSTSKAFKKSWATERHALGRILQIVAKYGGAIRLISGGAEVIYRTSGGRFTPLPNHVGYEPQYTSSDVLELPGSQLQLILPLMPSTTAGRRKESRSVLNMSLPESFRPQPDHVRGHLVPLHEELESYDASDASVGSDEQERFWSACEHLSRKLIRRPRTETLVLDFGGLNWTSEQFETLLHLLQNVLLNRPVLLVEIDPTLAQEVDELERLSAPTKLRSPDSQEAISEKSFGISEHLFLETFSRVHAPVLGLDRDGRKYLFGVLESKYKEPLLSLVGREASIKDLCAETFLGVTLRESHLRAILNNTNTLFEVSPQITDEELWQCVWSRQALINEASRAISRHFDQVALRCKAWRGRDTDLSDD
jgi:hypothetical protein